jgi:DNA-binding XRE family transcriptional regulator
MVDRPSQQAPPGQAGFGVLLRSLRERALISQEELAARAGLSVRAIGNLEQGRVAQPRGGSRFGSWPTPSAWSGRTARGSSRPPAPC